MNCFHQVKIQISCVNITAIDSFFIITLKSEGAKTATASLRLQSPPNLGTGHPTSIKVIVSNTPMQV